MPLSLPFYVLARTASKVSGRLTDDAAVLHLVVDRGQNSTMREERLHIFRRVKDVIGLLPLRLVGPHVVGLDVEVVAVDEREPLRAPRPLFEASRLVFRDVAPFDFEVGPPAELVPAGARRPGEAVRV